MSYFPVFITLDAAMFSMKSAQIPTIMVVIVSNERAEDNEQGIQKKKHRHICFIASRATNPRWTSAPLPVVCVCCVGLRVGERRRKKQNDWLVSLLSLPAPLSLQLLPSSVLMPDGRALPIFRPEEEKEFGAMAETINIHFES